jgi:hypothetical protein
VRCGGGDAPSSPPTRAVWSVQRCLEQLLTMSVGGGLMDVLGGAASPSFASDAYGRFERWCSSSLGPALPPSMFLDACV